MVEKCFYPMAEKELCVRRFSSGWVFFKLTAGIIPIDLETYTICSGLSTGSIVNLLQIVSPKTDWCPGSPLNKPSVPKSLEGILCTYFSYSLYQYIWTKGFRKAFCDSGKSNPVRKICSFPVSLSTAPFCLFFFLLF